MTFSMTLNESLIVWLRLKEDDGDSFQIKKLSKLSGIT